MAAIVWTDDEGAAELANIHAGTPAARFSTWEPISEVVGAVAYGVGTGVRYRYPFRTDRGASFTLDKIPETSMDLMVRLVEHLDGGGEVAVYTDDGAGRSYARCVLAEGAELPHPTLADPQLLEYAMAFRLVDLDGARMLCVYAVTV